MRPTPETLRALDGQPVDLVSAAGLPWYRGVFRVSPTPRPTDLPDLNVFYERGGRSVRLPVPHLLIPAVLATEDRGRYVFWYVPDEQPRNRT